MVKNLAVLVGLSLAFSGIAAGSTISIGFITFDRDAPVAGQNEVSVNNYTGAALGCGVFDPGLPVCTSLLLLNPSLTVSYLDLSNVLQMFTVSGGASIGAGTTVPALFVFPGSLNIKSLVFSATINQTLLSLAPSGSFLAGSTVFSDPLIPGQNELSLLNVASPLPPGAGARDLPPIGRRVRLSSFYSFQAPQSIIGSIFS